MYINTLGIFFTYVISMNIFFVSYSMVIFSPSSFSSVPCHLFFYFPTIFTFIVLLFRAFQIFSLTKII